jgi:teichuronic acid exporter
VHPPTSNGGPDLSQLSEDPPGTPLEPAGSEAPPANIGRSDTKLGTALKWSYLLSTGGNVVIAALTFVTAALLGPREFGVVTMGMVWVALALVLLQHGPTLAVIQREDLTDTHVNAAFWFTIIAATGYAVVFAATAPLWAALNHLPELTAVCLALSPAILIQAINVIPDAVLRRRLEMRGIAIRVLLANLGGGLAAIVCAVAGFGVWALVAQQLVWPTLYAIMLWRITGWRPRRGPILKPMRDIRRMTLETYGGAAGSYVSTRVDVVLMGVFFGPVMIGLYRFATRLSEMVNELTSGGLRLVSLAHLSRHSQDPRALAHEIGRLMRGTALLSFPALGIVAGIPDAIVLFIGDQWAFAAQPLRVMCVTAALVTVATILAVVLQATHRAGIPAIFTWISMALAAAALVVSARLSADAGDQTQLVTVAIAMLAVQALMTIAQGYIVFRRVLGVSPTPVLVGALPGLASAVTGAVSGSAVYNLISPIFNPLVDLLLSGAAATAAAGGVLLLLDRQARDLLRRLLGRTRRTRAAGPQSQHGPEESAGIDGDGGPDPTAAALDASYDRSPAQRHRQPAID